MDPIIRDILRIIHVLAGVGWAGSTFMMVTVIGPSAQESQPESGRMMGLVGPRFRTFAAITGGSSFLTGLILFWFTTGLSSGAFSAWVGTQPGAWLTVGAVFGTIAFILGVAWAAPLAGKIVALGEEIALGGGPPSPEQGARMGQLQQSQFTAATILAILFVITIAGMAGAGV